MYDGWMDRSLATGSTATGDYERLNSPAMDAALAKLAGAETSAEQTAPLAPIVQFVAANLPIISTTTSSQWFQYNSQNYTGSLEMIRSREDNRWIDPFLAGSCR